MQLLVRFIGKEFIYGLGIYDWHRIGVDLFPAHDGVQVRGSLLGLSWN